MKNRMESDRIVVYTTNKMYQAEIVREILADHEIISFLINKMDSSYQFGDIEIYVDRDDVILSKKLIREFEEK